MAPNMVGRRVDGRSLRSVRGKGAGVPALPAYVAYYRVSTQRQGRSGLGLEAQRDTVRTHVAAAPGGAEIVAEFTEVESGRKNERPQLVLALEEARRRRATFIVAKIDRLSRNSHFLQSVLASGVAVVFCDLPNTTQDATGRFMVQLMANVAELEAGLISQRTKAALAVVKASGRKLGNPRLDVSQALTAAANREAADRFALRAGPRITELRGLGLTYRAIADRLNDDRVPSAHEQQWHAASVRAVLLRTRRLARTGAQAEQPEISGKNHAFPAAQALVS